MPLVVDPRLVGVIAMKSDRAFLPTGSFLIRRPGVTAPTARVENEHTPDAIRERLARGPTRSPLRDFVYGAIDGIVTTFAVVAGVAGAGLETGGRGDPRRRQPRRR
jgi:hypothetical protein